MSTNTPDHSQVVVITGASSGFGNLAALPST